MTAEAILTVNAGSSSLKFAVFESEDGAVTQIMHGQAQSIGGAKPHFSACDSHGKQVAPAGLPEHATFDQVIKHVLRWVQGNLDGRTLGAAGHRVVHGGRNLVTPTRIDERVLAAMQALVPLAPLHQPLCLASIRAVERVWPDVVQVACFDTAFHRTMPEVARRFAIPESLHAEGVERYGFHGLSYEYIAGRLRTLAPDLAAGRVVVAHLGNGASLCAVADGRSVDTTMGMTALDGLPMGTRCGSIDPGVLLYLLQAKRMSADELEDVLYHRSGFLGVSSQTGDLKVLEQSSERLATAAVELFAYQVARQTCMMASALGGLDGVVFTAGIGEHAAGLRRMVCERLAWLGVHVHPVAPEKDGAHCISTPDSAVAVWIIPTNEEMMIARHTAHVLAQSSCS